MLAIAAVLLAAAQPDLAITLSATKSTVLVGEPVKLVARISTTSSAPIPVRTTAVRAFLNDGRGYRPWAETTPAVDEFVDLGVPVSSTSPLLMTLYLGVTGTPSTAGQQPPQVALPTPGVYTAKTGYEGVFSNEVSLEAKLPEGRDAELFSGYFARRPELLSEWATLEDQDVSLLEDLIRDYKGSPYLYRPQLTLWDVQIRRAVQAYGSSTGTPTPGGALDADLGAVLRAIQSQDWSGSPYDENRLALVAETRLKWGDRKGAVGLYREILSKYPTGVMAQLAKQVLKEEGGDTKAPTLKVAASPSTLWPPNSKLVPVTVAVTVSDDTDPRPTVTLVSVTCNDACNPTQDVVGATLNTDDRTFQLMAWRTGSGSGRTYTITYSATDASGNSTTAKTTVVVPHDQGN